MSTKTIFSDSSALYKPIDTENWNNMVNIESASGTLTFTEVGGTTAYAIDYLAYQQGTSVTLKMAVASSIPLLSCPASSGGSGIFVADVALPTGLVPSAVVVLPRSNGMVFHNSNPLATTTAITRFQDYAWTIDATGIMRFSQVLYDTGTSAGYFYYPSCFVTLAESGSIADAGVIAGNLTFVYDLI